MTAAAQHSPHRRAEAPGQVVGLVKAALQGAQGMQGHGHDGIGATEHVGAGRAHQRGQRRGQRASFSILEGVDDLPQRAVVAPGAARQRELRFAAAATSTQRQR